MRNKLRRPLAFLLSAVMIVNMWGTPVYAAADSGQPETGLCEHHPEHTADCGYTEGAPGTPCDHEHEMNGGEADREDGLNHNKTCYTLVTECVHEHTEDCYPATDGDNVSGNIATPSEAEKAEPTECTHECSEDSGCITKELDCQHEHNEDCGYTEETPGTPCTYVCDICENSGENGQKPEAENGAQEHCSCIILCTEDNKNPDCPVCGAEGANLTDCKGKNAEEDMEQPEDTDICKHHQEHDKSCGYQPASEDGEGSPCAYDCLICPIEDLIVALPDEVTEDNEEEVRAQLEEILTLFGALTEEQQEQIDLSHVYKLQEALDKTNAPMLLEAVDNPTLKASSGRIHIDEGRYAQVTSDTNPMSKDWKEYTGTLTITGKSSSYASIIVYSGTHNIVLDNVTLRATAQGNNEDSGFDGLSIGESSKADVILSLEGNSTIKGSPIPSNEEAGRTGIYICSGSSLTIQGNGSLRAVGGNSLRTLTGMGGKGVDIVDGSLTVEEGAELTAVGGNEGVTTGAEQGASMYLSDKASVLIQNTSLSLEGFVISTDLSLEGAKATLDIKGNSIREGNLTCNLRPGNGYYGKLTVGGKNQRVNAGEGVSFSIKGEGRLIFTNETYNLTVNGGSGSGSFQAGETVSISAGASPDGTKFRRWELGDGEGTFADAESENTTFTMGWTDAEVQPVFETAYTLTVNGGTATEYSGLEGESVILSPDSPPSGQSFSKWELTGPGVLSEPYNSNSSFTFGAGNATVTAQYVDGQPMGDFLVITDETDGFQFEDGVLTISGDGTYTVKMVSGKDTTSHRLAVKDKATVILDGVNIQSNTKAPVEIGTFDGQNNITLKLNGINTLKGTERAPGLATNTNYKNSTTLTITSLAGDGSTDGTLNASADMNVALGAHGSNPSTIHIKGGTIVAVSNGNDGITAVGGGLYISGGDITAKTNSSAKLDYAIPNATITGEAAIQLNGSYIDVSKSKAELKTEVHITYGTGSSSVNSVAVTPKEAALLCGESQTFIAQIDAGPHANTDVVWTVTGGDNGTAIDQNGKLTVSESQTPGTLTVTAANEYSGKSAAATVTVTNKAPTVEWPTASAITYGQTLSDSKLNGGSASLDGTQVDGTFAWKEPASQPNTGTAEHAVMFTPTDSGYEVVEGTISVTVKKAALIPAITGTTTKPYDGTTAAPADLSITLKDIVGDDDVTATASFSYNSPNVNEATTITADNITLGGQAAGNYTLNTTTITTSGTITKAVGLAPNPPTATEENITDTSITLTAVEGAEYSMDGTTWQDSPQFTGLTANTAYSFYIRLKENDNYTVSPASTAASITTKKTMLDGAVVTVSGSYTYTGKPQTPAASDVAVTLGNRTVPSDQYTFNVSGNTDVGQATVTVTAKADGNYSGTASGTFTIDPAQLTNAQVTVSGSYTYTGEAQTPAADAVTIKLDGVTIPSDQYTISAENNVNAGDTAIVKATAKPDGNYTGTATGTFAIDKATPTPDTPDGLSAECGKTLRDVTLPTGWGWDQPDTSVGNVGNNTFPATYTQDASGNYNEVKKNLIVNVTPAPYKITLTGQADSPTQITLEEAKVETNDTGAEVTYGYSITNTTPDTWQTGLVFSGLKANTTYYFFAKVAAGGNYAETVSQGVAITTPEKSVSSIKIVSQPNLSYTSGQPLDLSGLSVQVNYNDNTHETIAWTSGKLTADPTQGIGLTVAAHHGKPVTISYGGKTDDTDVLTVDKVTQAEMTITGAPSPIYSGSSFTLTISGGSGTGAVIWEVVNGSATVDTNGKVTVTGTGEFQIKAVKTADMEYNQIEAVITLAAVKNPNDSSSSGDDSSSGSGDSSFISSENSGSSGGISQPDTSKPDAPITGETKPIQPDTDGNASVDNGSVQSAIDKVKEDLQKNGITENRIAVTVPVTLTADQTSFHVTIHEETLDLLVKEKVQQFNVVTNRLVSVNIGLDTLKQLDTASAGGDIILRIKQVDGLSFTEARAAIGTRPVYDLSLVYLSDGKEVPITSLNGHSISVRLPYIPENGEQTGSLYAVYVDNAGKMEWITKSSYDTDQKAVIFEVQQFGIYGMGYKNSVSTFTDITGHWAADNILFVVSRGLLFGIDDITFSPDIGITREMFATALGRLAGINPDSYKNGNFTDVKADTYYAPYVNWAAQMGIMEGITATTFSPNSNITREQIAVIMKNYADKLGCTIPKTLEAVTFADNANISFWAKEAVKTMQQAGILAGKSNNQFAPKETATRAEAATILRRFVEIVIDPQTANGWQQNDSGQWSYYRNGELVNGWLFDDQQWYWIDKTTGIMFSNGWKQIDGKWYYFYANGAMAVNSTIDGYSVGSDGAMTI